MPAGNSTSAPSLPANTTTKVGKYSWDRPSYKASCIPKGILLSTESGLSGERQVESAGAELLKKQSDVDKLLQEADIAQFEMTSNPQHWVSKYYGGLEAAPSPRSKNGALSGKSKAASQGSENGASGTSPQRRTVQLPSPRTHKLRGAAAAGAKSEGESSLHRGNQQQSCSDAPQQQLKRSHNSPKTSSLHTPSQGQVPSGAVTTIGGELQLERSSEDKGAPPSSADYAAKWAAIAARKTMSILFVDDLEYQAKEFMRSAYSEESVAFVFPLDDDVVAIFGGSSIVAKEVLERSGALHYSSVVGAEVLVADEIFRRKREASLTNSSSRKTTAGNQDTDEPTSGGEDKPDNTNAATNDAVVEDDLWYAMPKTSPVGVQKITNSLRNNIAQHLRDCEALLLEESRDA